MTNFKINKEVEKMLVGFYNDLFEAAELDIPKVENIVGMIIHDQDEATTGWMDQLLLETGEYACVSYMYDYSKEYQEYFTELVKKEECNVYTHYIQLIIPFVERYSDETTVIVDNKKIHTIFYNDFLNVGGMDLTREGVKEFMNFTVKQKIAIFARMIYNDLSNGNSKFSKYMINKIMCRCDKQTKMYVRECFGKNMWGYCCEW